MSFIPKNPITAPEIKTTPSPPVRGTRGLFPMADGWYDIDFNGNFKRIALGEAKSPYIGDNGNWFVWDGKNEEFDDTGVKAEGTDGIDGANGKDGVDGKDGTNGKDGVDGKDGADGLTPYIAENGNWRIGTTDTGVRAQSGSVVYIGDNPPDEAGVWIDPDGESAIYAPYIGNNGNWYTFNPNTQTFEDSGNSSKGEKGDSYILTEPDKIEIINNILNSLPSAEGVGF